MKSFKLTAKDIALLILLAFIVIGVVYYLAFYTPLQNELMSISNQCSELDSEIMLASQKAQSMNDMEAELEEIFKRPADEITEIAPYDNAKVVMNFLNGILARSDEYNLSFADPDIEETGTVRRNVNLSFSCTDYDTAKSILKDLASWNYRCLLGNVTLSYKFLNDDDLDLSVTATMTFFESTNIA